MDGASDIQEWIFLVYRATYTYDDLIIYSIGHI